MSHSKSGVQKNQDKQSSVLDQARFFTQRALDLGADEAKVSFARSRGVSIEWRDGQIERLQDQTEQGLSVSLFVDGRFSSHSTCDLRPQAVETFLKEAIHLTRFLEKDPYRSLPDPQRYEGRADVELELYDPQYMMMTSEERKEQAQALEQEVQQRGVHLPIVSVKSSVGDTYIQSARVHSNGFEGQRESSYFSKNVGVTLKEDDGKRPMGGGYTVRRFYNDLRSNSDVVAEALKKAESKLNAQKVQTGKYTILVENQSVRRLLGALLGPLSGGALQQKRSFWEGKLNTQIVSPLLTLFDEPHVIRGLGSSLWDGDGFSTHRRPLIENGVLKTFLINDYYAKKMGVDPTGGGTHNFKWTLGTNDFEDLVKEIGNGVLIDRFLGGNSNGTTGEISLGCGGRMIRNGELAEPLTEMNLSGNFGQLWSDLSMVGNDPYVEGSAFCPSCVFTDVQLSGV